MRLFKIVLSVIGLLILILLLAVAGLVMFMDPNKLKPIIINEVKKSTGFTMTIEGPLTWSLYPYLGVKAGHVNLLPPEQGAPIDLYQMKIMTNLSQWWQQQRQDWKVDFDAEKVRVSGIELTNVDVNMEWQPSHLKLDHFSATLYQGTVSGQLEGVHLNAQPEWQIQLALEKVQLQPLLKALNGNTALSFAGMAHVNFIGKTQGKDKDDWLNNLSGKGEASVKDGAIVGIDLNYYVETADALLNKQPVKAPADIKQTTFTQMGTTFTIDKGLAKTNNLLMVSPVFTTTGSGQLNVVNTALDFHLLVQSQKTLSLQWQVPMIVTGTLKYPDIKLDMVEVQKVITKRQIDKLKDKADAIIKEHVPGKTGEFLQQLIR